MWPFKRTNVKVYHPPRPSARAPEAIRALRNVPGPSPWYLNGLKIPSPHGPLEWRSAGDKAPFAGRSLLATSSGEMFAVADFYCYIRALPAHRMLAWYSAGDDERATIQLAVFEVDRLLPFTDLGAALTQLTASRRLVAATEPLDVLEISRSLADGSHTIRVPASFREVGEILMLAASTSDGRREDHFKKMHQRLWILDCATGTLAVAPQDWFNRGPYDFGYQWVTRMARIPGSGEIVGEGIRLGLFLLDSSFRQVAEWLAPDQFYHPEREPFANSSPEA